MIQLSILVSFFSVILICEYKSTPTAIIVPNPNPDPTITRRTMFGSIVNLTRVGHCDGEPEMANYLFSSLKWAILNSKVVWKTQNGPFSMSRKAKMGRFEPSPAI